jgi:hypothetical protein
MATFSYAAVLALIRVIERATIDEHWDDFHHVYDLPRVEISPGYWFAPKERRVTEALRELGKQIDARSDVKEFFGRAADAVLQEFTPPHGRNLLSLAEVFLGLNTFSGEGDEAQEIAPSRS